ncbi:MAG: hypothetical protein ACRDTT_29405 [Pseudonocardiaceae bacterium]
MTSFPEPPGHLLTVAGVPPGQLVTLGATATKALLGSSFRLTHHRGLSVRLRHGDLLAPVAAAERFDAHP